jgi:hypothetical protein
MNTLRTPGLLALLLTVSLAPSTAIRAQKAIGMAADEAALLASYREAAIWREHPLDHARVGSFLLLTPKSSSSELLPQLRKRAQAFEALEACIAKHYAASLGKRSGSRPLPVLLVRDAQLFRSVAGPLPVHGFFDPDGRHVVLRYIATEWSAAALGEQLHAVARLVLHSYAATGSVPFAKAPWIEHGLAAFVSGRPAGFDIDREDPGFRYLLEKRIAKLGSSFLREQSRPGAVSIEHDHHPLDVLGYRDVERYIEAACSRDARLSAQRLQRARYRDCCYLIVSYLELSFRAHAQEGFRKELGAALQNEEPTPLRPYGTSTETVLPLFTLAFASVPHRVIAEKLPDLSKKREIELWSRQLRGGDLFAHPEAEQESAALAPKPEALNAWARARALVALKALDAGTLADLADEREAKELRRLAQGLEEWQSRLQAELAESPGRLRLALPDGASRRYRMWSMSPAEKPGHVTLERKKTKREQSLSSIPAHLLAEAMHKRQLLDAASRACFERLIELEMMADPGKSSGILRRAKRSDLAPDPDRAERDVRAVAMAEAVLVARARLLAGTRIEQVFDALRAQLAGLSFASADRPLLQAGLKKLLAAYLADPSSWRHALAASSKRRCSKTAGSSFATTGTTRSCSRIGSSFIRRRTRSGGQSKARRTCGWSCCLVIRASSCTESVRCGISCSSKAISKSRSMPVSRRARRAKG